MDDFLPTTGHLIWPLEIYGHEPGQETTDIMSAIDDYFEALIEESDY